MAAKRSRRAAASERRQASATRIGAASSAAGRARRGHGNGARHRRRPRTIRRRGARPRAAAARASRVSGSPAKAPPSGRAPRRSGDRRSCKAQAIAARTVQNVAVTADENGMRVDRFLEAQFPGLEFLPYPARHPQRRGAGQRQAHRSRRTGSRPGRACAFRRCGSISRSRARRAAKPTTRPATFLKSITLYEDADVLVLNKPMGLAVQGGSGTTRHLDGMLDVLRDAHGQRPRLVHRLDKDTAGCLLVAKTRFAAAALAKTFRSRSARKIYWALVAGVPKVRAGPHLDLSRQRGARRRNRSCASPSTARRARAMP